MVDKVKNKAHQNMKSIMILFLTLIVSTVVNAQDIAIKSDLRIKVDSIIECQLKPQMLDSTLLRGQTSRCNGNSSLPIVRSVSSIRNPTMPLIILDGKSIELEELNPFQLKNISEINILNKNDEAGSAIYGSRGTNGVIIIVLKKKSRKILRKLKKLNTLSNQTIRLSNKISF